MEFLELGAWSKLLARLSQEMGQSISTLDAAKGITPAAAKAAKESSKGDLASTRDEDLKWYVMDWIG